MDSGDDVDRVTEQDVEWVLHTHGSASKSSCQSKRLGNSKAQICFHANIATTFRENGDVNLEHALPEQPKRCRINVRATGVRHLLISAVRWNETLALTPSQSEPRLRWHRANDSGLRKSKRDFCSPRTDRAEMTLR